MRFEKVFFMRENIYVTHALLVIVFTGCPNNTIKLIIIYYLLKILKVTKILRNIKLFFNK